jgi:poly-gamma-glutamate capsule biosynthesis protein CapA/YwtB (metallophosphatase superfamily)
MLSMLFALPICRRPLLGMIMMLTSSAPSTTSTIRVLLHGGDSMLGRAVQLTFPIQAPGEELIQDSCTAQHYLQLGLHSSSLSSLADIRNQNKNRGSYLWGRARLDISPLPDLRIMNLETAVTKTIDNSDIPGKGINYHMHTDNFENIMSGFVQTMESPVVLNFSNNHCLDFGRKALEEETLPMFAQTLLVQMIGCGRNLLEAVKPAVVQVGSVTVQVFGFATACSGTPQDWSATEQRSGVIALPSLRNDQSVDEAIAIVRNALSHSSVGSENSIRVVSLHWGPNWAMKGERDEDLEARETFAHRLIDECDIDLIYGHSSHHARGMEVYHDKLILYGTGDIINDYEGFEKIWEKKVT